MSGGIFTLRDSHASDINTQAAIGGIEAQDMIESLRADNVPIDTAWLRYVELAAKFGKNSAACRAYVLEAFKRAAVHA
jgi:hypothetical protein